MEGHTPPYAPTGRDSRTRRTSRRLEAERTSVIPRRCPGQRVRETSRKAPHGRAPRSRARRRRRPTTLAAGRDEASRTPTAIRETTSSLRRGRGRSIQSLVSASRRPPIFSTNHEERFGADGSAPPSVESNDRTATPMALGISTHRSRARLTHAYENQVPTSHRVPAGGDGPRGVRSERDRLPCRSDSAVESALADHPGLSLSAWPSGWTRICGETADREEQPTRRWSNARATWRGRKTPHEAAGCSSPAQRRSSPPDGLTGRSRLRRARRARRNDLLQRNGRSWAALIEFGFAPPGRLTFVPRDHGASS